MNQNRKPYKKETKMPEKISIPLSKKYTDPAEIFLDTGIAYKIADKMGDIPPHHLIFFLIDEVEYLPFCQQLRKILNVLKEAVDIVKRNPSDDEKFKEARNKLYYIVPLTAYNAGRDSKIRVLYDFVYEHINEKSIQSKKDIEILDQLFTSIIAYHKCKKSH